MSNTEEAWAFTAFAVRGLPDPADVLRQLTYEQALAAFSRERPGAGEALAALQVAQAAIRERVPYDENRGFNADTWRRWAADYGAIWPVEELEKAPWEL